MLSPVSSLPILRAFADAPDASGSASGATMLPRLSDESLVLDLWGAYGAELPRPASANSRRVRLLPIPLGGLLCV